MPRPLARSRLTRLRSRSDALVLAALTTLLAVAPPAAGSLRPSAEPAAAPAAADRAGAAVTLGELLLGHLFEDGKLLASDGAGADEFARAVAVSGDTIVVGSPLDDDNGMSSGSVYVFTRPPGGWAGTQQEAAKLLPSDGAVEDQFGESVAISGDTIVVGASWHAAQGNNSGQTYVFVRPAGGWAGTLTETAKLLPTDGESGDRFGESVAVDGDTIAAGATGFRVPCGCPAVTVGVGAVYVFTEPAGGWAGTVIEDARLMASDPPNSFQPAQLGGSVAVAGDTVIAGDLFYDTVGGNDSGAAFVFVEPAGGWAGVLLEDAKLLASDGESDELGTSVAVSGTTVVAGAPLDDDAEFDAGAAYVFTEPAGGWGGTLFEDAKLVPSLGLAEGHFGRSVAVDGAQVVAGAYSLFEGEGSGYLYTEPPGGWAGVLTENADINATDGAAGDFFGGAVAAGGGALIVGAMHAGGDGAAYVYDFSLIFADGFESGDTSAWSATTLEASPLLERSPRGSAAALGGESGDLTEWSSSVP
jgi:hypothetical protein